MILTIIVLATFGMLLFLGAVQSHWIAPATLFAVSAPVVMALSHDVPIERTVVCQAVLLASYYLAFAIGRWGAPRFWRRLA